MVTRYHASADQVGEDNPRQLGFEIGAQFR
jgi:hypothetical protein